MPDPNQPSPPASPASPASPFPGLTIARVVHYVLTEGPGRGQHRPAFVTKVIDPTRGIVNIHVFRDFGDSAIAVTAPSFPVANVKHSTDCAEGTWHWPERAE